KPGKDPEITITVVGNKLMIQSDDPKILDYLQDVTRLMKEQASVEGEGDFHVVRLQFANAVEVARVLDEAFNGPKQQANQQPGGGGGRGLGFFGPSAGQGAQTPANPRKDRIRVVADTSTNSLLVRANALDMLAIKRLLEKALDTGNKDSRGVVRS